MRGEVNIGKKKGDETQSGRFCRGEEGNGESGKKRSQSEAWENKTGVQPVNTNSDCMPETWGKFISVTRRGTHGIFQRTAQGKERVRDSEKHVLRAHEGEKPWANFLRPTKEQKTEVEGRLVHPTNA